MGNPRKTNGHRRRELRRRVLASSSTCALCGEPVDKTLPAGHPGAPEVDEILPVSLGGSATSRSNTQLVHRACNQRKGARPIQSFADLDDLDRPRRPSTPKTSRDW